MSRVVDHDSGTGGTAVPLDPDAFIGETGPSSIVTFLNSNELMWSVVILWYFAWFLHSAKETYDRNAEALLESRRDWS